MKRDWRELAAAAFVVLGGIVMVVGWVGVSQSNEVYEQLPYLFSGGLGGLACILIGLGLYVARNHARHQARIDALNEHLRALELGLGGEFDEVFERLDRLASDRRSSASFGG
jgi:multisubunit Na+/H+ antiporter MnhG subunit